MSKGTILLVDDEEHIVEITKIRLEHNGYTVITAFDGNEALEKAKTCHPDLILLDVMLPKIDGHKICKILKFDEQYRHIPIVILTALSQPEDRVLAYESGADKYLCKPVDPPELIGTIATLLNSTTDTSAIDIMNVIPLFNMLSDSELSSLKESTEIAQYAEGTLLNLQKTKDLLIIVSGELLVSFLNQTPAKVLGANAYLGESEILLGIPIPAKITAIKITTCLKITLPAFIKLIRSRPEIAVQMGQLILDGKTCIPVSLELTKESLRHKLAEQLNLV